MLLPSVGGGWPPLPIVLMHKAQLLLRLPPADAHRSLPILLCLLMCCATSSCAVLRRSAASRVRARRRRASC